MIPMIVAFIVVLFSMCALRPKGVIQHASKFPKGRFKMTVSRMDK